MKVSCHLLCRFVVGPYEESGYAENREDLPSTADPRELRSSGHGDKIRRPLPRSTSKSLIHIVPTACCRIYHRLLRAIQGLSRHTACPHPFSCTYYTLQVNSIMTEQFQFLHLISCVITSVINNPDSATTPSQVVLLLTCF
jgi:hypothetical protein